MAFPSTSAFRARGAALVLLVGALLGGCTATPSASERWCQGLCSAVSGCGFYDPDCETACVAERPSLAALSDAVAEAEASCLAKLSCNALSGDVAAWNAQTRACRQDAVMVVTATPRSRAFCTSHARVLFDCGYTYGVDDCAQDYAVWSDAILAGMAACETQPSCDTFLECERRVGEGR